MNETSFHLALPVKDIEATTAFYTEVLKCPLGRSSYNWVDVNFYGHQITFHQRPKITIEAAQNMQKGSGPVAHFGVVLPWTTWHETVSAFQHAGVTFLIEPDVVMEGKVGEQVRFFISDPDNYGIEFKSFHNPDNLFKA